MTLCELIDVLQRRLNTHGDVEVEVTWEQTTHRIGPENVYLSKSGALHIDADFNQDKPRDAVDPHEGETESPARG